MNLSTNWGAGDGETYTVRVGDRDLKVLTQSGAAIGFIVKSGNINLDNVTVRRTTIGADISSYYEKDEINTVTGTKHAVSLYAKDVLIENSWANDILCYGFGRIELDSSYCGVCSGSAIHIDSLPSKTTNPELHVTNGTVLENWVTGGETWFTVYKMNTLAPQLMGMVNQGVMDNTANQMQAYKTENGLNKVNLVLIVKDGHGTGNDGWTDGKDDVGYPTAIVTGVNELSEVAGDAANHITEQDVMNYVSNNAHRIDGVNVTQATLIEEAKAVLGLAYVKSNAKFVKFDTKAAGMTVSAYIEGLIGIHPVA